MPTYTYLCESCSHSFELFSRIKDYNPNPNCQLCHSKDTNRQYVVDVSSQYASVKKSNNELKTLGDIAMRNTEKMSDDEKTHLYMKHNSYKDDIKDSKALPSGMTRIQKPKKIKWPGTNTHKKKRDTKK